MVMAGIVAKKKKICCTQALCLYRGVPSMNLYLYLSPHRKGYVLVLKKILKYLAPCLVLTKTPNNYSQMSIIHPNMGKECLDNQ